MRILGYSALDEQEFLGCLTAFVDTLTGELNAATMYLRKLQGQPKGAAFAFEMALDHHRYGVLMVLDRWARVVHAFGPHLDSPRHAAIVDQTPGRVQTAENILGRTNQVIDASHQYTQDLVEPCVLALQSLRSTFAEEGAAAERALQLGPMLPESFERARRVFLGDLAVR